MPQRVKVDGLGVVEFPDLMPAHEVAQAINTHLATRETQPAPQDYSNYLQGAIPADSEIRARTGLDALQNARFQIGQILEPIIGPNWLNNSLPNIYSKDPAEKKRAYEALGTAAMNAFGMVKSPEVTSAYHGTNFFNLPDLIEWIRNPSARRDKWLFVTDTPQRAARYANAQISREPALAYNDLIPGAAVVEVKVPRTIEWMKRGENYQRSLDAVESFLLPTEQGMELGNIRAVMDPYSLEHSALTRGDLKILKPDPSLIDPAFHMFKVKRLLESMNLGDALRIEIAK